MTGTPEPLEGAPTDVLKDIWTLRWGTGWVSVRTLTAERTPTEDWPYIARLLNAHRFLETTLVSDPVSRLGLAFRVRGWS